MRWACASEVVSVLWNVLGISIAFVVDFPLDAFGSLHSIVSTAATATLTGRSHPDARGHLWKRTSQLKLHAAAMQCAHSVDTPDLTLSPLGIAPFLSSIPVRCTGMHALCNTCTSLARDSRVDAPSSRDAPKYLSRRLLGIFYPRYWSYILHSRLCCASPPHPPHHTHPTRPDAPAHIHSFTLSFVNQKCWSTSSPPSSLPTPWPPTGPRHSWRVLPTLLPARPPPNPRRWTPVS